MTSGEQNPRIAWQNKMGRITMLLAGIDKDYTTVATAVGYGSTLTELAGLALQAKEPLQKAAGEIKAACESQETAENALGRDAIIDPFHRSLLNAQDVARTAGTKLIGAAQDYAAAGGIVEYESPLIAIPGEALTQAQTTMLHTGPAIETIRAAAATGQQAAG